MSSLVNNENDRNHRGSIFGRFEGRQNQLRSWALTMNNSELKQFYEFNPNSGIIVNRLRNQRVFVLSADSWADMESGVYQAFGSGASVFLEKMGHNFGASTARNIRSSITSIALLKKLAAGAGFGTFSIRAEEEMGTWIRVDAKGCVFCHGSKSDRDCSFLSGIVHGLAEELYRKQYIIIRRKCYGIDESHMCEIVLQEAYYDPVQKRRKIFERALNPLGEEFR